MALVANEVPSGNVTDIFHTVRRRCPEWAVTPHRVRKALIQIQAAKRKAGKQGAGAKNSLEGHQRIFPHDVVELRPNAGRCRHAQWQWRGQVLRVAGYDDGETTDDEDQELPPGHCYLFWLGHGLEQWPNVLTKASSIKVIDRPWVLGDRVARSDDPRSLGTIVGVSCRLKFSGIPGPTSPSPEVPAQAVRAVGGFRAEDWVAHEATRWVGKVEEAVFRVEVELCGKSEPRQPGRNKSQSRHPVCVFQVSSEGLHGLEPAGGEDVTPQELSPHFPGQRVRAPARLWKQAEWIRGSLGRRSPRRGASICGVVASVECCLLAVRWLAGVVKDSDPPDEWVAPESLRVLTVPNSSEGWAIGDHVQTPPDWMAFSAVIVESRTVVDVRWADGTVEEGVPSLKLCPRPHMSAHDFLPQDFVARSSEGFGESTVAQAPAEAQPSGSTPTQNPADFYGQGNDDSMNINADENMYGGYGVDQQATATQQAEEILPTVMVSAPPDTPLGVVASVNLQARTAEVQWPTSTGAGEPEEVSVFELQEHPQVDVRLGDAVLVPDAADRQWAGRICGLRPDAKARVELLDGTSQWIDVRRLVVVDDGEGAESHGEGGGSEEGSTRSDGALSEISEGREAASSDEGEQWADARPDHDQASFKEPVGEGLVPLATPAEAEQRNVGDSNSSETAAGGLASNVAAPAEGPAELVPFDVCDENVEPTDHFYISHATLGTRALMMAVRREMQVLRKGLLSEGTGGASSSSSGCRPNSAPIVVRTFSSRSDLFRAMVVGPPDTPYAYVPFFFDLALPPEYPRKPPVAHFHAHYVGNERLNPNLYVDGKVCLSLLGTWSGPSWDPEQSTLLQVLVSLQGLVLVEEPYFNEPGHECDVGTEQGQQASALYNEHARLLALRAAINAAQNPPRGFEGIVAGFFARYGPKLVEECETALQEPRASQCSQGFRRVLERTLLPRLRERWGSEAPASQSPQ